MFSFPPTHPIKCPNPTMKRWNCWSWLTTDLDVTKQMYSVFCWRCETWCGISGGRFQYWQRDFQLRHYLTVLTHNCDVRLKDDKPVIFRRSLYFREGSTKIKRIKCNNRKWDHFRKTDWDYKMLVGITFCSAFKFGNSSRNHLFLLTTLNIISIIVRLLVLFLAAGPVVRSEWRIFSSKDWLTFSILLRCTCWSSNILQLSDMNLFSAVFLEDVQGVMN